MRKLWTLALAMAFSYANAQGYSEVNKVLHRMEQEAKINQNTLGFYDLEGKKFLLLKDFPEKTERKILEIKDGKSVLVELQDDRKIGKISSKIYTGDLVRAKNVVSVRADYLEGQKIGLPITYTYSLFFQKGIWYLVDRNTGDRWIDTEFLGQSQDEKPRKTQRKKKNRE